MIQLAVEIPYWGQSLLRVLGGLGPFRVKIRTASFSNVSITPWLLRGVYVPDIITILASLYFILGDIDR